MVHPTRRPPSVRLEVAVLQQASAARSEVEAVAVLADACQSRRTSAQRLLDTLATLPCLRRRRLLGELLHDVASGAHSVLEHRYLTRVERPHGLPTGAGSGESGRGSARSTATVLAGATGVRLGWRQVLDPCRAAAAGHRLLVASGWTEELRRCGPGCTALDALAA